MAREELAQVEDKLAELSEELKLALLPKHPNDEKNVIVEVRAGTGGAEASLFASDLYRAYTRYAQIHNWKVDVMDTSPSDQGGFNKIVFEVQGKGAFSRLKYERGVHRVQRVPDTEAQGRIRSSEYAHFLTAAAKDRRSRYLFRYIRRTVPAPARSGLGFTPPLAFEPKPTPTLSQTRLGVPMRQPTIYVVLWSELRNEATM